jgi:hypothetical protein
VAVQDGLDFDRTTRIDCPRFPAECANRFFAPREGVEE